MYTPKVERAQTPHISLLDLTLSRNPNNIEPGPKPSDNKPIEAWLSSQKTISPQVPNIQNAN